MKRIKLFAAALLTAGLCAACFTGCGKNPAQTNADPSSAVSVSVSFTKSAENNYEAEETSVALTAESFFAMPAEQQIVAYEAMDGETAYKIVGESNSSWCVQAYNLVTPENIKELVCIYPNGDGTTSFNLNWPVYGGYAPETITGVDQLQGTLPVSRVGGDGGYTICYGTNEDGSQFTTSQRSLPETNSEITTGTMNVDLYKKAAEIVTGNGTDDEKMEALGALGFDEDSCMNLISDYENWLGRPEISGENNIADGVALEGHTVDNTYGYCGKCAAWSAKGLNMEGGCNQMNTIFSWGTLKSSGIVTDTESVEI